MNVEIKCFTTNFTVFFFICFFFAARLKNPFPQNLQLSYVKILTTKKIVYKGDGAFSRGAGVRYVKNL